MIKKIAPAFSLNGTITPPPDKSISQRAAIFALLHDGKSVIKNYSPAEDPQSTLNCVELLGAEVTQLDDVVVVEGRADMAFNLYPTNSIAGIQERPCGYFQAFW